MTKTNTKKLVLRFNPVITATLKNQMPKNW